MARTKKKKKGGVKSLKAITAAFLTILTIACLAWVLLLPPQEKDQAPSPSPAKTAPKKPASKPSGPTSPKKYTFEEKLAPNFDQKVRQVDLILMQALAQEEGTASIEHNKVQTKYFHGSPFHFQELAINLTCPRDAFLDNLRRELKQFTSNASLSPGPGKNVWFVLINGKKTHTLFLHPDGAGEKPRQVSGAMLAIVIDDMGRSKSSARRLAHLDIPVTFSILPHSFHAEAVRNMAGRAGIPVMLHLPMQPESWPETNPGPGALFVNMSPKEIQNTVKKDLELVPEAIGANNHMGSRFTADKQGMEAVFRTLESRNMFFLDSLTTPKSVTSGLSGRFRVRLLKRDIFLDNIQEEMAIIFQLRKAEQVARSTGRAVAIGHPYPETINALEKWSKTRDKKIRIVTIRDLL